MCKCFPLISINYQTVQRTIYEDSKYIEVLLFIVPILVMLSN
nr:MAG TPA: hypothetical protein [Crassvirales sp.]